MDNRPSWMTAPPPAPVSPAKTIKRPNPSRFQAPAPAPVVAPPVPVATGERAVCAARRPSTAGQPLRPGGGLADRRRGQLWPSAAPAAAGRDRLPHAALQALARVRRHVPRLRRALRLRARRGPAPAVLRPTSAAVHAGSQPGAAPAAGGRAGPGRRRGGLDAAGAPRRRGRPRHHLPRRRRRRPGGARARARRAAPHDTALPRTGSRPRARSPSPAPGLGPGQPASPAGATGAAPACASAPSLKTTSRAPQAAAAPRRPPPTPSGASSPCRWG